MPCQALLPSLALIPGHTQILQLTLTGVVATAAGEATTTITTATITGANLLDRFLDDDGNGNDGRSTLYVFPLASLIK
ncbi:hypothetical protein E2C01_089410 [Portunus trituberculatus]|uniref:Uncharacterized protein n=1 Tax=Portunus trituberculatus TaxID=210409 RepID=A0A5B7JMB1_PORTR|nr:hypothetical protein [Portunus trituberculatus]